MIPKVSVLMAVHNGGDYLRDSIESILSQSYEDFELVVVDDASSDGTWMMLKDYASGDSRVKLVHNPSNIGLTRSLNKGLRNARGLYVARQDHDDVSLSSRLERQVQFLDANPQTILVSCDFDVIDQNGKIIRRKQLSCAPILIKWNLIFSNYLEGHSQVMFRREPAVRLGGYKESFRYAQDYDLWRRLSQFGEIAILPEVLLKYRTHDKRLTHLYGDEQFENILITSSKQIADLIGKELNVEEVKRLWVFWCLVYRFDCLSTRSSAALSINTHLKSIFTAFFSGYGKKYPLTLRSDKTLVRRAIAKRYYRWFKFELIQKHNIVCAVILLAVFGYWLRFDWIFHVRNRLRPVIYRTLRIAED